MWVGEVGLDGWVRMCGDGGWAGMDEEGGWAGMGETVWCWYGVCDSSAMGGVIGMWDEGGGGGGGEVGRRVEDCSRSV
jgi:hypothetical protein